MYRMTVESTVMQTDRQADEQTDIEIDGCIEGHLHLQSNRFTDRRRRHRQTGREMQCKENPSYVFLSWELRGLSSNFHIHVSVSDLYTFPGSVHIFPCSKMGRSVLEIYNSLKEPYKSVGTGRQNVIILFWK
jgi:hypothetical protein